MSKLAVALSDLTCAITKLADAIEPDLDDYEEGIDDEEEEWDDTDDDEVGDEEEEEVDGDVTDECEVELGTENGGIRMYLTHNGRVITRAGLGKPLELTSYAQSAGYKLVETGRSTKRGRFFRVLKS